MEAPPQHGACFEDEEKEGGKALRHAQIYWASSNFGVSWWWCDHPTNNNVVVSNFSLRALKIHNIL